MKNSHLFSDYMVASSVNRSILSINQSPTSGVVHKQRSSYGPRLTLLNGSKDGILGKQKQTLIRQGHQYIQKILLLSLQISRLSNINQSLRKQSYQSLNSSKVNGSKQLILLKQTNQSLKIANKTLESSLMRSQQEKSKIKVQYIAKVSQWQAEGKSFMYKVDEYDRQIQRLVKQRKELTNDIQRLSLDKRRLQIDLSRFSKQMQRSIQSQKDHIWSQKNHQISYLKQTNAKLQSVIIKHRQQISSLEQQNQQISNRQAQLLLKNQQCVNQIEQIKNRINYQLKQANTNTKLQMQGFRNSRDSLQKENQRMGREIQEKQRQMGQMYQQIQEKCFIISELKQNNFNIRGKYEDLQRKNKQKQFYQHKRYAKLNQQMQQKFRQKQFQKQNLKQQLGTLTLQIELLQKIITQQRETTQLRRIQSITRNQQINQKLKKTQRKLRKVRRKSTEDKQMQNVYMLNTYQSPETKLFKSHSINSTSFFSSRLAIDVNLGSIVTTAASLQNSNERSQRLINKSQELMDVGRYKTKSKRKFLVQVESQRNSHDQEISSTMKNDIKIPVKSRVQQESPKSSIQQYYGEQIA